MPDLPPYTHEPAPEGGGLLRVRLDLAYDGRQFAGWAPQPGQRTVCGELATAVQRVLRVDDIRIVVAGRTDAGVHALGQVCHLDLPGDLWPGGPAATRRINAVLPADILVLDAQVAPAGFDARFSAQYRRYEYLISDSGRHDPRPGDPCSSTAGHWTWCRCTPPGRSCSANTTSQPSVAPPGGLVGAHGPLP